MPLRLDNGCTRGEGTHEGCPYGWITGAHGGEGTHEGCPYGWIGVPHVGGGLPLTRFSEVLSQFDAIALLVTPLIGDGSRSGLLRSAEGFFLTGAEGESKVAAGIQHFSWVVMAAWWDWEDRN